MKFPYTKIPTRDPQRKWIARPLVPIVLYGASGRSTMVVALVDSGADSSLFHASIGTEIGLSPAQGIQAKFAGIEGGGLKAWLHKVSLEVLDMPGTIELTAGFTNAPGVSAILGQAGFFDRYRVAFEKDRDIFEIQPVTRR